MTTTDDPRHDAILRLERDRALAHKLIFERNHQYATPPFHAEIIADFHSNVRNIVEIAFRGAAKSTLFEEGVVLGACFHDFRHAIFLGSSLDRACERLHAVRRAFEKNEYLIELFGHMRSRPWGDELLELASGQTIRAMGRGQAIRGTKNETSRPDLILCDDIEDDESVRTDDQREKVRQWFFSELLPSGDQPALRVRVAANDLHPDCLANLLDRPRSGFVVRRYPWIHLGADGQEEATWPERFPLAECRRIREMLYASGRGGDYEREYMCRSERPETKTFKPDMLRIEPRVRTWEATYAMIDPARTVRASSATTGIACWSWIGPRLHVWEGSALQLMPDQIVETVFRLQEQYQCIKIGFEEDGLNEWALQPIRAEQMKRGLKVPLEALKAPKSKLDFIRGLQPWFVAREVWLNQEMPEFWAQFLSFPGDLIDGPNALAYALHPKMKPGIPVYEDFTRDNVAESVPIVGAAPVHLALNATHALTTAVLAQWHAGRLVIAADWVREGDAAAELPEILKEAQLEAERTPRLVAPAQQFDRYNNAGLVQAASQRSLATASGGSLDMGRQELRGLLRSKTRGLPALLIARRAHWAANAFAGGYARATLKGGAIGEHAEDGPYRVLMEGLEAYAALLATGETEGAQNGRNYVLGASGRPYISARPGQRFEEQEEKTPWTMR